jgi:hypothetical protein
VDFAGDVALQTADDLALVLALAAAPFDVVPGRLVVAQLVAQLGRRGAEVRPGVRELVNTGRKQKQPAHRPFRSHQR